MRRQELFVALVIIAGLSGVAVGQAAKCSIPTFFVDLKSQASTSRFLIATFPLELRGDEFTRNFIDKESGRAIYVGRQLIKGTVKKERSRLRLKVSFTGKPNDSYDSFDGAEAETIYDKRWKWLAVTDEFKLGDRIYTFTFGCEQNRS